MLILGLGSDAAVLGDVAEEIFVSGVVRPSGHTVGRRLKELEPSESLAQRWDHLRGVLAQTDGPTQWRDKAEQTVVVDALLQTTGDPDVILDALVQEYGKELYDRPTARATLLRLAAWSKLGDHALLIADEQAPFLPPLARALARVGADLEVAPAAAAYLTL